MEKGIVDEKSRWDRSKILSATGALEGADRDGAVAIEDGRIAAVGTIDDLGAGHHFPMPRSCLGSSTPIIRYAVYAGSAMALVRPWLHHIERKADNAEMEAIARLGAAECLGSGITTVADLHLRERARRAEPGSARHLSEVFGPTGRHAAVRGEWRTSPPPSRIESGSASAAPPYTCLPRCTPCLGVPVRRISTRAGRARLAVHGNDCVAGRLLLVDRTGRAGSGG